MKWCRSNRFRYSFAQIWDDCARTALPFSIDLMRENRQVYQQTAPSSLNHSSSAILSSSKEEDTHAEESQSRVLNLPPNHSNSNGNNNNKQRFVYIASPYVASTTHTSYHFLSTTVTRTVDVAIAAYSGLLLRLRISLRSIDPIMQVDSIFK